MQVSLAPYLELINGICSAHLSVSLMSFPFTLVNIQAIHQFSNVIDVQFNLLIGIANDAIINYGLLIIWFTLLELLV